MAKTESKSSGGRVKLDDGTTVDIEATARCRGCGRDVGIGRQTDADRTPTLLHKAPVCPDFEKREVLDYLEWNRTGGVSA